MNSKKKLRKFFTLSRKADGGFTLVELIVVIAILAILGGVAVPAYSGYVKKANMQADITLTSEVEQALMLACYSGLFGEEFAGGSVVLSTNGARVDSAAANDALAAAMEKTFGEGWADLKLKYDGWTNTKGDIKTTIAGSSFADTEGNLDMELLGAVDNLTGQLGEVMSVLDWNNFDGFTVFLDQNGIDRATSPQLAANSAVLYLAQTSMDETKRAEVAGNLKDQFVVDYDNNGEVYVDLTNFLAQNTGDESCTEFEALAMVYAAMTGYCLQKGEDTYNDFITNTDLLNKVEGTPTVKDEGDVLKELQKAFAEIVYDEENGEIDEDFWEYLDCGDMVKDINAYYGVIDGISENQDYLLNNLDGSKNFYAGQQNFLQSYWDLNIASGEVAVMLTQTGDGQPQVAVVGMGQ